jgi:hypothetical protein
VEIPRGFRALPEAACSCTYQLLTEVPTGGCSDDCDKKDQDAFLVHTQINVSTPEEVFSPH